MDGSFGSISIVFVRDISDSSPSTGNACDWRSTGSGNWSNGMSIISCAADIHNFDMNFKPIRR